MEARFLMFPIRLSLVVLIAAWLAGLVYQASRSQWDAAVICAVGLVGTLLILASVLSRGRRSASTAGRVGPGH